MDPVSELLAQPFRLEKTTAPTLSDVAVERMNTVPEYAQSEKLPYMTYDQVMSKAADVYSPSDFTTVGQRIRDNVVKAIETRFPVVGEKYTLKVENVHYEKPKQTELKEEKEVILKDGSLNDRLKGTWVLYDNATGKEVSRKNATLLNVPRMTSRGTFIRNGSEIGLKHMFRLRSGVYTHIKNNGRVSAHINPEQTTGQQMSVEMEPSTGVFSISRGTRTYGLLPILKAAGVPDDVVKGYMGDDLYKANYEKYGKLMGSDSQMEEYRKVWAENMAPIKLDAETTESTLGKGFSKMDPDVLLRASGRILQVSRTMSDNDTDDRDSLRYQRVMGPADYIPERIVRDGGGLLRKLFNTVTKSGNLDAVVTGAFQSHVDSVFLDDKHAGYIDGSSPMEALDFANMISRIGEGGIGSLRAAPAETRGVNDSYLGFIDPVRSPECGSADTEVLTKEGWKNIATINTGDFIAGFINGVPCFTDVLQMNEYDYDGEMIGYDDGAVSFLVTPEHRCVFASDPDSSEFTPKVVYAKDWDIKEYNNVYTPMTANELGVWKLSEDKYFREHYKGKVYCPTVAGGLIVIRRNNALRGVISGNSLKVGLDIYLTHGIMKDSSGKLYNKFKDRRGTPVVVPMDVTSKSIVATPEFYDPKGDPNEFIPAMYQGKGIEYVKRKDVDFYVDNSNTMMSVGSGMIPLIGGIRSNRTLMGCLHPGTMLAVIKDNKPTCISAFDLWVLFSDHTWGVPSLDDDNSSIIYRQIKKVVRHDLDDFDDPRLAAVTMRIFDDDDAGGLVCICTMDHKWVVRVGAETAQEQLLTTRDIMKTLEDGIKVYAPAVGYPHNASFGALYGKSLNEVGYWKELSAVDVLSKDSYKDHFVIDIDVDDHVYMLANGMFTHNSKYANQAVALQEPEAPLVQRKMVDKDGNETTTEKFISRQLGAKYAPVAGKVLKVDADSIVIAGRDGQKHTIDLYNEYPANQKGFIHNTALVKPGDKVEADQILAKSNYTDDEGTAALGTNLRVAFLTGRNAGTFEDSITISESAAKKMSSTQLYKLRGDTSDDIEYSKRRYLSLFKDDFTPEQLDKIDDNGLPKPGVVFQQGDPVYLGVQTRDIGVHGLAKNAAVPYVTRWEHSAPGTVTNVVQGKKHLTVYTKAVTPMEIGDKLCFDDQTEILTDRGWKLFKDLDDTERVLTMDLQTCDTWMTAYSDRYSYKYKGKMYRLKTKYLDICTTPDHEHLVSVSNHNQYVLKLNSKKVIGKKYFHIVGQDVCNPHNYKPSQTEETEESWVDYDGRVYCVTVPYTHTVFVRRNGKTVWSGNSSRYGAKGTVGSILPDEEMPKDSNGNTFDVLQSPLSLPSRLNTSMLAELALAKIARKHGIKYQLPDFIDESIVDYVDRELNKHGVEPDEDVYDPVTGKTVPSVQTGELFFYKLKHMAELKERGRSTGTYSAEDVPLKGEGAARRLGGMESSAVFSGGGMEVLRDAKIVRGQRNDEFWRDYRSGKYPETPGFPLVHQKFFAHLKAAGVNLEDKGDRIHLYGATDANMKELTGNRQVTKAATFESKNMQPIAGGLFDPTIFGADGDQWGYVDLPEPVLNPIMFKTVGSVLGWKDKELTEYLEGSRELNGKFGTQNLIDTLNNIDLPKELARAKQVLKSDSTTLEQRDMARKRIRAIEPMIREGKKPSDFFFTRMPILPPRFRPVTAMSNGVGIAADANFLYKRMMDAADDLREAKEVLPEEMQLDARKQLYSTVNAVTGLTPTDDPKLEAKGVAGVLKWAFGKGSPKCYDPETEILTEKGWIKFPEYVELQDYELPVMTYKMETGKFEWQKPQRIFGKEYKGDMVHTFTDCIDTCVTSDHMHYVSRWDATKLTWDNFSKRPAHVVTQAIDIFKFIVPVKHRRSLFPARSIIELLNEDIDDSKQANVSFISPSDLMVDCRVVSGSDSKFVPYDGLVYCVTVPNGLVVTRRNGKTLVSGNCGSLHRKVFGANLDLGSLGTITPDNSLTIDQVGIPERSAWKMFEPFVVRKLVQQGASVVDAMKGVLDQTDEARRALIDVMKDRPVLLNRAPTLWRYGIQGMYPVLVEGNALRVNPNVCKLYGADFDGDSVRTSIKIAFSSEFSKIPLDKSQNDGILYSIQQPNKEDNMLKKEAKVVMGNVRCAICDVPRIDESIRMVSDTVIEWDVPAGVLTECIDRTTGEKVMAPVTKLSIHKDVDMYDVHMATYGAYKHIVTCSKEDTLLTYKDGEIAITDASTAKGAVVPKARATDMGMDPEYCAKYIKLGVQVPLTFDVGVFLGLMIGDGWVDANNVIRLAAECPQIQERMIAITTPGKTALPVKRAANLFEYDTERFGSDKQHRLTVYLVSGGSEDLRNKIGSGAYNKRIPLESMAGSRAHRVGVLLGLIATDGSVTYSPTPAKGKKSSQKSILFHTTSQYLRDNIIDLCYSLGIKATATAYRGENSLTDCYAINLSVRDTVALYNSDPRFRMIADSDEEAMRAMAAEVTEDHKPDSYDIVPFPKHISILMGIVNEGITTAQELNRYKVQGFMSRDYAKRFVIALRDYDYSNYVENRGPKSSRPGYTPERVKALAEDWIRLVENEDVQWEVVTDVVSLGKMDGWDVTVPGPLTFTLGSGTFVQDSMTTHVPVSKEAVKAIDEKMLPSRNLLSPIDMKAHFIPVAEFTQGLYLASRTRNEAPIRFKTKEDMMAALNRGEIKIDTPVVIG